MTEFFLFTRTGLLLGITYALIAYAFTMTYKSCRAFNFAVGQSVVLSAFAYLTIARALPTLLAALLAMIVAAAFGVALYFVVVRRPDLRQAEPVTLLILLLGVSIVIDRTIPQIWGYFPVGAPPLIPGGFDVGDSYVPWQQVAGLVLGITVIAALLTIERRTLIGKAIIATGSARQATITIGINDRLVQATAWAAAFVLLATAALIIAPITSAAVVAAPRYSVLGISAAFIGGLGKGSGALAGGLVIGLGSSYLSGYVSTQYADAILFVSIVVFLLARPTGILGGWHALKGARA